MASDKERIASLEAHKDNTAKAIDAIFQYMKEGRQWREEAGETLASMKATQIIMGQYQIRCDKERAGMQEVCVITDKRLTVTESFQRRQIRAAVIIAGLASLLGTKSSQIFDKLLSMLS